MKTERTGIRRYTWVATLVAVFSLAALGAVPTAEAQHGQTDSRLVPSVTYSDIAIVRGTDLASGMIRPETLTRKQWREMANQMRFDLASRDASERALGLQSAIHLAIFHAEQVNCHRAVPELLDVYLFERDDALRIMSVAALDAIGNREAIATLAERVGRERSPLVKHVTMHAVANLLAKEKAR
jgi:hypothetical protein